MSAVAVVIPCWNLGRFLPDAIDSVHRQTRPAAEVVVVDDGSTDPLTLRALAEVEATGRARVVRAPHRGVAHARNLGLSLTHAPSLVLLDADDRLDASYIERLAGALDGDPSLSFVTCGVRAFGDASYTWTPPPCDWVSTLVRGGPHVSSLFRRELWTASGGFDAALEAYEDLDFWLGAIERGACGTVVDEPLLHYRIRHGSRYRRALGREVFTASMRRIYERHRGHLAVHWPAVIDEKERFLQEQRAHGAHLHGAAEARGHAHAVEAARTFVNWGDLARLTPVSDTWGLDRGRPVDRHYIEAFLAAHAADIRGRVLEVKDAYYTTRFGGSRVTHADVVDIDVSNPHATLVMDLAASLPAALHGVFDCIVCTQTLHMIHDVDAAAANLYRLLKPGGVLLATAPSVSRVSYEGGGVESGDYWRFTQAGLRRVLATAFPPEQLHIESHGNVKVGAAFLFGLAVHELSASDLAADDPWFPLLCCARAVKPQPPEPAGPDGVHNTAPHVWDGRSPEPGAVLLYHRIAAHAIDPHGLCVGAQVFGDHLAELRAHAHPLPLDELLARAAEGTLPPRAVTLTFDDGYLDNLTTASPLLEGAGVPATFFLNTDRLDTPHEAWWDELASIFLGPGALPDTLDLFADGRWVRPTGAAADREAAHHGVVEQLYTLSQDGRRRVLDRVFAWAGYRPQARDTHRLMTADEVRELARRPGHVVGAHSVHHLCLPAQDIGEQYIEVAHSVRALERCIGRPVTAFAYPYGEHSRATVRAVAAAGVRSAVTVNGCAVGMATQPLCVARLEVRTGSGNDPRLRLENTRTRAAATARRIAPGG